MQADSLQKLLADAVSASLTFDRLIEGFMALGLIVGVAALGVVSARSVVERRQQIGVLRAIGYRRSMVQACFLIESSFVALTAIVVGTALGLAVAYNVISDTRRQPSWSGMPFDVPWLTLALIFVAVYGVAMLTTLAARATRFAGLPRRGAALPSDSTTPSDGVGPVRSRAIGEFSCPNGKRPSTGVHVHAARYWNLEPFVARFHPCGVVLGALLLAVAPPRATLRVEPPLTSAGEPRVSPGSESHAETPSTVVVILVVAVVCAGSVPLWARRRPAPRVRVDYGSRRRKGASFCS